MKRMNSFGNWLSGLLLQPINTNLKPAPARRLAWLAVPIALGMFGLFMYTWLAGKPESAASAIASQIAPAGSPAPLSTSPEPADSLRAVWVEQASNGEAGIWAALPGGKPQRLLALSGQVVESAALSPDGRYLALVSESGSRQNLWLAELADRAPLRLLAQGSYVRALTWNPDGTRLAYRLALPVEITLTGKAGQPYQTNSLQESLQITAIPGGELLLAEPAPEAAAFALLGWAPFEANPLVLRLSPVDFTSQVHSPAEQTSAAHAAAWTAAIQAAGLVDSGLSAGALLAPDGASLLTGSPQGLLWLAQDGSSRVLAGAERGLSALWSQNSERVLLSRWLPDDQEMRLEWVAPRLEQVESAGALHPSGEWRLLALAPDDRWLVARRGFETPQIQELASGDSYVLSAGGEFRAFAGWLAAPVMEAVEASPLILNAFAPFSATLTVTPTATPTQTPTPIPTCAPVSCPVPRSQGYQPLRTELKDDFVQAAQNTLGSEGPTYFTAFYGLPPNVPRVAVAPQRPLPNILMNGVGFQESVWVMFSNIPIVNPDNRYACTLLSFDCGYGLMQITSCMDDGCGWFDTGRVSAELRYNLGTGANFLVSKWNGIPYYLGENDHTHPADWYMAVTAYNGLASSNNPNNPDYDPRRAPYLDKSYVGGKTYQERIYGWMAHPEQGHVSGNWLWRPTRIAEVPRGMFGLNGTWIPIITARPLVHVFYDIQVTQGVTPTLLLTNPTGNTLAADILLYNQDGSFNRRWLDPSADPPWFAVPYIRLAPGEQRIIPIHEALLGETFNGLARVVAIDGVQVTRLDVLPVNSLVEAAPVRVADPLATETSLPTISAALTDTLTNTLFLPAALLARPTGALECREVLLNGGFEALGFGQPVNWTAASGGGYALADSTWLHSGHYSANLAGYDNAQDRLSQALPLPSLTVTATLTVDWYGRTWETAGNPANDLLQINLRNPDGSLFAALASYSNQQAGLAWNRATFDLSALGGQALWLWLEASTNASAPTQFFVDNVSLTVCSP